MQDKIKVAVNGYGVIGKRVADAILAQPDMHLVGIADVATLRRLGSPDADPGFAKRVHELLHSRAAALQPRRQSKTLSKKKK